MLDKILGVAVVVTAMLGSSIIAMNVGLNLLGYMFFMAHSICALLVLERHPAPKSIVITTIFFAVVNFVGIVRYGLNVI